MIHMTTAEKPRHSRVPHDSLPLRLVMLRHECGVSQKKAAERIGVTARVWQGMEEGRNTADLLGILKRIADEFDYDLDWLTWGGPLEQRTPRRLNEGDGGNAGAGSVTVEKFSPTQKLLGKRKPRSTPVSVKLSTRCNDSSTAA